MKEMIKTISTNFLLKGTLRMGTVIGKVSMPFRNIVDFNTKRDLIQLTKDGDDVVFTGRLIEFCDPGSEKTKGKDYGKELFFLKLKKVRKRILFILEKVLFYKMPWWLAGKPSKE